MESRGGIPISFMLLMVFGLLIAGIVALAGFAIDDALDDSPDAAVEGARAAAFELVEEGLAPADLDVAAYVAETHSPAETVAFLVEHQNDLFGDEDSTEADIERAIVEFLFTNAVFETEEAAIAALSGAPPPSDGDGDGEAPTEPTDPSDLLANGDADQGSELYFANGCNACHGDTGGGGIGPTIAATSLSLEEVIAQYRNPRAVMPAFPADRVSDQEVAHIYTWLQTLN